MCQALEDDAFYYVPASIIEPLDRLKKPFAPESDTTKTPRITSTSLIGSVVGRGHNKSGDKR